MFVAVLFIIGQKWKTPNVHQLRNEQHNMIYLYNGYYSNVKRTEALVPATIMGEF
jgi:hypothetical protein